MEQHTLVDIPFKVANILKCFVPEKTSLRVLAGLKSSIVRQVEPHRKSVSQIRHVQEYPV